jgi:hypothetical protein
MMPAKILDFAPRSEYDRVRWERISAKLQEELQSETHGPAVLTSGEIYSILYGETVDKMHHLIRFYKHSGKWNADAETQMTKIVKSLQTLCETIAHASTRSTK